MKVPLTPEQIHPERTPRERFIAALERRPLPGRVSHFELVFYLTMEVFGRVHPLHRDYDQWGQMSETERQLHREDMADLYIAIAERFEHDAILLITMPPGDLDEQRRQIDLVREKTGDRYFLMIHGDATFAIPGGEGMMEFACRMADDPRGLKAEAARNVEKRLAEQEILRGHGGLDGLALCSDYCFNTGPFVSPAQFDEFIFPYLREQIASQREMGYYVIKHTDGNIMPILDQLVACRPHALHSLDPQGGVEIAEVVRRAGDQVCVCGNVNCGLLQTGTEAECVASVRHALAEGMRAPGYVFCTSNCVYTGMPLARYELMLDLWREPGVGDRPATDTRG